MILDKSDYSYFINSRSNEDTLLRRATREKEKILKEFKQFYKGDIDILIKIKTHVMGISVCGDLMVNGEVCRTYDPIDLCFLDLNEMMLKRLIRC